MRWLCGWVGAIGEDIIRARLGGMGRIISRVGSCWAGGCGVLDPVVGSRWGSRKLFFGLFFLSWGGGVSRRTM